MTPEQKAKELIEKFAAYSYYSGGSIEVMAGNQLYSAKQCALIAVEEILDCIDRPYYSAPDSEIEYWQQVKEEIEKL